MRHNQSGTPFVGYISLTSAAPGPLPIPMYVIAGSGTPYSLQAGEKVVLEAFSISSNDTTPDLVTITDGAATPKKFVSVYNGVSQPPAGATLPIGLALGKLATALVATSTAITATKTVEITIYGVITTT